MRRPIALLTALAALAGAAPAAAYDEGELSRKLQREMRLVGSASGAYVQDLGTGEELFALREDRSRIPASVDKLLTTSATILRLGPATRIETSAVAAGAAGADGVLRGDLYLVGRGDPFFSADDAARLAREVRIAGITRIEGAVVGDESFFDERRSGRYRGFDRDVGGVLSGLSYDRGISRGRAQSVPAAFAAAQFAAHLRRAGVRSGEPSRAGVAPGDASAVATVFSPTVRSLVRLVNQPSNNFAAEMLLKGLGARHGSGGTTRAGANVVRTTLRSAGVAPRMADGSGLSRANRITPRDVVDLLDRMDDEDVSTTFRSSLATAGRNGTLRERMRGTPASGRCRAKTGTLRDVSALAGYCRTRGGRHVAFAFLANGVNPTRAKRVEDRMAAAIARLEAEH